ncbi:MAG: GIY-YIG nuclease family protein [Cyclobacteriaceae bacterium]
MYFVYVLRSEVNGYFYVGMTADVNRRLNEHNTGKNKSTRAYKPWKLFFYETLGSRKEARSREKYLKSGVGKEYIKNKWPSSSTE